MTLNCMYMRSCRTKFSSLSNLVSCDLQFNTYIDQHNIVIWRFVPHCLMWCIWWEWNSRSFEGREQSIFKLKSFFFFSLLEWCLVLPSFSCFSLPVLLDHCNLVSWCFCLFVHFLCTGLCVFNKIFMLLIKKKYTYIDQIWFMISPLYITCWFSDCWCLVRSHHFWLVYKYN